MNEEKNIDVEKIIKDDCPMHRELTPEEEIRMLRHDIKNLESSRRYMDQKEERLIAQNRALVDVLTNVNCDCQHLLGEVDWANHRMGEYRDALDDIRRLCTEKDLVPPAQSLAKDILKIIERF